MLKKLLLALAFGTGACVSGNGQNADWLRNDALSAESQEQYADAARLFEQAYQWCASQNLTDTVCLCRAGMNYLKAEQFEKAVPLLEATLSLHYRAGTTARALADAYVGSSMPERAEQLLLAWKDSLPADSIAFDKKLAYLYFNAKQFDKAAAAFGVVTTAQPSNKNDWFLYGFSLEQAQKRDRAIAAFRSLREQFPGDRRAGKWLGITIFERADAGTSGEMAPGDTVVPLLGPDEIEAGYEQARVLLEEALVEFPHDQQIIAALYGIYTKQLNANRAAQMKKRMK